MPFFLIFFFSLSSVWAKNSVSIPVFLEALSAYVGTHELIPLRPPLHYVVSLLKKNRIDPALAGKYLEKRLSLPPLREDAYDQWGQQKVLGEDVPEVALHALKIKVREESDDVMMDDLYAYFFITDGAITTGKVSSVYRGLSRGETFFFNDKDRALFPIGIPAKRPTQHLIIDYGIIESDGDDLKELQKLSAIIVDIATTIYTQLDLENGQVMGSLRQEIKALSELILGLNHDDRLVTHSFGIRSEELKSLLAQESYVELRHRHKYSSTFDDWSYDIYFRLIRNSL